VNEETNLELKSRKMKSRLIFTSAGHRKRILNSRRPVKKKIRSLWARLEVPTRPEE